MKITDIKTYPVWVGARNQMIVKVETDEGLHGWGESGLSGREMAVVGAVKHYREFLIGRDPLRMGALWQEMYRSQYFEGGRALTAAISAIDIALYDIAGKALNVPVYQLLGGKAAGVGSLLRLDRWINPTGVDRKRTVAGGTGLASDSHRLAPWPPGGRIGNDLRTARIVGRDRPVADCRTRSDRTGAGVWHRFSPSLERG